MSHIDVIDPFVSPGGKERCGIAHDALVFIYLNYLAVDRPLMLGSIFPDDVLIVPRLLAVPGFKVLLFPVIPKSIGVVCPEGNEVLITCDRGVFLLHKRIIQACLSDCH